MGRFSSRSLLAAAMAVAMAMLSAAPLSHADAVPASLDGSAADVAVADARAPSMGVLKRRARRGHTRAHVGQFSSDLRRDPFRMLAPFPVYCKTTVLQLWGASMRHVVRSLVCVSNEFATIKKGIQLEFTGCNAACNGSCDWFKKSCDNSCDAGCPSKCSITHMHSHTYTHTRARGGFDLVRHQFVTTPHNPLHVRRLDSPMHFAPIVPASLLPRGYFG